MSPTHAALPHDRVAEVASSSTPRSALLRIAEAAGLLDVSRSTLYQLVAANAVPVVRIPRDALLRWIENQVHSPES